MALITDYATLQAKVSAWIHRTGSADFTAIVPDLIQFGENRIYRDLRVRQMETALSGAIASGVLAVPSGYLELKFAYIDATPVRKLERKDAEFIYAKYPTRSATGQPAFIARDGANFIFGQYPDSAYTVKGAYYKQLAPLSDSNTTNWLITDAPELILFAALCEAEPWLQNDSRIALWESKYTQIKDQMQRRADDEEFSGSPLSVSGR
jgi:hypothetical protein